MTLKALQAEFGRLQSEAQAILKAAKADDRELTAAETAAVDKLLDEAETVQGQVKAIQQADIRAQRMTALDQWGNALEPASGPPPAPVVDSPAAARPEPPKFKSFGEMLQAVAQVPTRMQVGQPIDPRLGAMVPEASTGLNESVPSQGGFLVQTDWANEVVVDAYNNSVVYGGGPGFPGVRKIPLSTNANGIKINGIDETNRAAGSRWGGVRAYWPEEGGTKTASKPAFRQIELNCKKLIGLCYATDELLQDASALEAVIRAAFSEEFAFNIQDALINGSGAGLPLGILNANCLVSVTKETNQASATIVKENIDKMYARMKPSSVGRAVWFINQNCYPQLFKLTQTIGTGGTAAWMPPGGMSGSPFGTLYGRPVVPIEQCQSLGTVGDIYFADMSQYLFCDKGGVQSDSSIHVAFTTDETCFRFVYRCDGQPALAAALTPFKGTSDTIGPFIALATRS